MKKLIEIAAVILVMTGCHCNAPVSVKKADKEAQKLTVSFVKNNNKLFKRVADFYKAREYAHIEALAKIAKEKGASENALKVGVAEAKKKVDAHYVKMLEKFLEIQKDLQQAVKLRSEISRFMENKINYKEFTDILVQFAEKLAKK
jgi:hypothetical protein